MDSELSEAVQYEGGPVNIEVIMAQIRDYLARKQGDARARSPVQIPSSRILALETYDELYQANWTFDKLYVAPYLTSVNIPVLGAIWQKLRGGLHNIAIFYVNRLAEAQIRFNGHAVRVLDEIVSGIDANATPDRVEQLERKVRELEARLAALDQRSAGPERTQD
jgi:hypothetical protein